MYSTWLTKTYSSVSREDLRTFMSARLKVFYEEELSVPLVVFVEVMEHVQRLEAATSEATSWAYDNYGHFGCAGSTRPNSRATFVLTQF